MSTPPLHSGSRQWKLAGAVSSNARLLDVLISIVYFAIGFSPITALAVAIIGLLPLSITTLSLVLPATVLGVVLALRLPRYGKLALRGLIIGLIAVFLYDCMRVPFIITGVWGDFIPKINMWLLPGRLCWSRTRADSDRSLPLYRRGRFIIPMAG